MTKAPHAGSKESVTAIVARCLAFGLKVERVVRKEAAQAEDVAHALYPDVWLNFERLPSGDGTWMRLAELFDNDEYASILAQGTNGTSSSPAAKRASTITWATTTLSRSGRPAGSHCHVTSRPVRTGLKSQTYSTGPAETYDWYRGPRSIGIQKVNSGIMAFALRHDRLYGGRPVVVLNGHFALLSQRFRGPHRRGAAVIELSLGSTPGIRDVRHRLIGAADLPAECLPARFAETRPMASSIRTMLEPP